MLYLSLYILVTVISQTMLKACSLSVSQNNNGNYLINMFLNYKVILAYLLSIFNLIVWVFALTKISLLKAVVCISFSYVIFLLVDWLYFKEQIKKHKIVGVSLITLGVLIFIS